MSLGVRLSLLLLSLAFAALSYALVENPIRHSRKLALRPAYQLLMAAGVTISVITVTLIWRQQSFIWAAAPEQAIYTQTRLDKPVIYSMGCDQYVDSAELKLCSFGPQNASKTAVLLGDSHAGQWFPTAQSIFVGGGWHLIVMTKSACPAVDSPFFYEPIGRTYSECDEWRAKAIDKIRELRPDVVMVGTFDKYPFSPDQWKVGTHKVLASLSESSRHVLLIRDTPNPGIDTTMCLARSSWRPAFLPSRECRIDVSDNKLDPVYSIQEELAGRFPNVSTIDMNAYICDKADCEIFRNGVFLYRDSHHLSSAFAAGLANEFAKQIRSRFEDLAH
jgi:hypothetical protein